jgi:hypothetical protein
VAGDPPEKSKVKALALVWTYPLINYVLISYTISSQWVYDLMTLMYQNQNQNANFQRHLRQQMNVFVIAIVVFVIIMYLVYILSLPLDFKESDLPDIFYFIAIFEWIVAAILFCSIFLYVKRIAIFNEEYGKTVFLEASVFIISNVLAGIFNFWMGRGEVLHLIEYRDNEHLFLFAIILLPYFAVTEFIPALVFASTVNKFSKVIVGENQDEVRAR